MASLRQLDAEFYAISADQPEALAKMAGELQLSYRLLSDPDLRSVQALGAVTQTHHPRALIYPKKAFLQPSVTIFDRTGRRRFTWVMKPSLLNLFGAARRYSPEDILAECKRLKD